MREIKFRAWDEDTKKMLTGDCISMLNGEMRIGVWNYAETEIVEEHNAIFMQFTGLKDKNGVEIYEGDIVRILYTDWGSQTPNEKGIYELSLEDYKKSISDIGFVEWGQVNWQINFGKGRFGEDEHGSLIEGIHGEKEIIGNIWEHEHLLNQNTETTGK